jgi:hypothetical protein
MRIETERPNARGRESGLVRRLCYQVYRAHSELSALLLNRNKQDWYVDCGQIILNSQLSLLNSWQEEAYQAGCSLPKN